MSAGIRAKKAVYNILVVVVFFLVMIAVITNIEKFKPSDKPFKYIQVVVKDSEHLDNLAGQYCDERNLKTFKYEVKRINKIESDSIIENKTLIIPVMISN